MTTKKTVLFFSGSLRKGSFNTKVAQYAYNLAKDVEGIEAKFIKLNDFQAPIYNADDEEASGLPKTMIALKEMFWEAKGFFIASPEYNSGYSGVLKNTIDWLSRPHVKDEAYLSAFTGKIAAVSSASPGKWGGIRGSAQLRLLLSNINVHVIANHVAIPSAHNVITDSGEINDPMAVKALKEQVEVLLNFIKKVG